MKMAGKDVNFPDLVRPEYIGSRKGSSLAELKKAAEDNGLYARPATRLSKSILRRLKLPVILHVKPEVGDKEYSHFELFLGANGTKATLFDPPETPRRVAFRDLMPRWDRTGLILSAEPTDLRKVFAGVHRRIVGAWVIIAAAVLLVRWAAKRVLSAKRNTCRLMTLKLSTLQFAALGIVALSAASAYHFAAESGFLVHPSAVDSIQHAHSANFIPKINLKKARRLLRGDTLFIDARRPRAYEAGHLDGAISLPVDANNIERNNAMSGVPATAPIVVYCQSAGSKFAENMALKLSEDGFSNVAVFKGGWEKWKAPNDRKGAT
jgi:rhodanese-related sulfurtransferase